MTPLSILELLSIGTPFQAAFLTMATNGMRLSFADIATSVHADSGSFPPSNLFSPERP